MIPQVETLPVASLLSLPLQMSTPPLPLSLLPPSLPRPLSHAPPDSLILPLTD